MKLSIIVPVYNMAADHKLEYCLDSLVAQTLEDYEIIAVDDCSTDASWEILTAYEKKYPAKFHAVHLPENRKQGGAKNVGIEQAKGEWIGFIDSDDWITPDFYERLIRKGEETGADMVGCDYSLTDRHSMEVGQVVHNNKQSQTGVLDMEKYRSLILDSGSLVVKVYRREIVVDHPSRFPTGIFYEDNALANSWMLRAKHFEYIEEPLYFYYQHDSSTVHTISVKRCEDRMEAGRIMLREAREYGYLEKYRPELEFTFTTLFYVNTLFTYMQGVRPVRQGFVRKLGKEMRETFPDFQKNPYYIERVGAEEKKLVKMQLASTAGFILYYKLLWGYRNFRKKTRA
jgi:glycosyltransferase involved in cell wall biosynthesis